MEKNEKKLFKALYDTTHNNYVELFSDLSLLMNIAKQNGAKFKYELIEEFNKAQSTISTMLDEVDDFIFTDC